MQTFARGLVTPIILAVCACSEGPQESIAPGPGKEEVVVPPVGRFLEVAVSNDRSCSLHESGDVYCWGLDLLTEEWDPVLSPRRVQGVESAVRIELSGSTACALIGAERGIQCWGRLPPQSIEEQSQAPSPPVMLAKSEGAVDIAIGSGRICAVMSNGVVRCWGSLGDPNGCFGDKAGPKEGPFDLDAGGATSIAVSGATTCFTRRGGSASCVFGDQEPSHFDLPFQDATSLAVSQSEGCFAARDIYCAIGASGDVRCAYGPELPESFELHDADPRAVALSWFASEDDYCVQTVEGGLWCSAAAEQRVIDAESVAITTSHACAAQDGVVRCWGSNEWGAVGAGLAARRSEAQRIPAIDGAVSLAVGEAHSCATSAGGEVLCWGSNTTSQLGSQSELLEGSTFHPSFSWSPDSISRSPTTVPSILDATDVFADGARSCATRSDGRLFCWGMRLTARMNLDSPTAIPEVMSAESVAAGDDSESCAALSSGDAVCWGRGWYGAREGLETLRLPSPAIAVDGDTYRGCAVLSSGQIYCWGGRVEGSIGEEGQPLSPQRWRGIEGAIDVSGTCAVTESHELLCLDDGATSLVLEGVIDVDGPCVIREDRSVACAVDFGTRERSSEGPRVFRPVQGVSGAQEIGTGRDHACARTEDGGVFCWGWSAAGRLGDGSRTVFTEPVAVTR